MNEEGRERRRAEEAWRVGEKRKCWDNNAAWIFFLILKISEQKLIFCL